MALHCVTSQFRRSLCFISNGFRRFNKREEPCVISGFGRGASEFRQLPTFRDNLSVRSARVK